MTKTKIREIFLKNATLLMFIGAFCNSFVDEHNFSSFLAMCVLLSFIKVIHSLAYKLIELLIEVAIESYNELED